MKHTIRFWNSFLLLAIISLTIFPACHINYSDKNLKVIKEKDFTISPGKELKLVTSTGDVEISTWDKPEVKIKILGNARALKKVEFTFNSNNEYVEVIAESADFFSFFGSNIRLKYEITVPKNFNNTIKTSGGDIMLNDISGIQSVKTSGGNVSANSLNGKIEITTSGGDIYLNNSNCTGNLQTSGGNIKAEGFSGDLSGSTSGGDINLMGKDSKIFARTSGGNIHISYEGENKGMDMETSGGDIVINLPADFSASVNLRTSGGDIRTNLNTSNIKEVSNNKLIADLNKGGNLIRAITSGGNIKIE